MKALLIASLVAFVFHKPPKPPPPSVAIAGPADWGVLQPSVSYENAYDVRANNAVLSSVSLNGDPQFTIDDTGCAGAVSCSPVVSLLADRGGDYATSIVGVASTAIYPYPVKAHVVGANFSLDGQGNPDSTATFTLTSTGETDLTDPSFAVSTYNEVGTAAVVANTCDAVVPVGTSCQVAVLFTSGVEGAAYGYLVVQAYGSNTRQQDPVRFTLALPPTE
jgi:hypothetical protein